MSKGKRPRGPKKSTISLHLQEVLQTLQTTTESSEEEPDSQCSVSEMAANGDKGEGERDEAMGTDGKKQSY